MDYLRSCYRTQMHLYADDPDRLTPVRWYFVPADRPLLDVVTPFRSRVFEIANREELPALGEIAARTWDSGHAPAVYSGRHYCGSPAQWANGCLTTDPVIAGCCGPDLARVLAIDVESYRAVTVDTEDYFPFPPNPLCPPAPHIPLGTTVFFRLTAGTWYWLSFGAPGTQYWTWDYTVLDGAGPLVVNVKESCVGSVLYVQAAPVTHDAFVATQNPTAVQFTVPVGCTVKGQWRIDAS